MFGVGLGRECGLRKGKIDCLAMAALGHERKFGAEITPP